MRVTAFLGASFGAATPPDAAARSPSSPAIVALKIASVSFARFFSCNNRAPKYYEVEEGALDSAVRNLENHYAPYNARK